MRLPASLRCALLLPALMLAAGATTVFAVDESTAKAIGSPLSALDRGAYDCRDQGNRVSCQAQGGPLRFRGLAALAMTLEYDSELLRQVTVQFDERQFEAVLRQLEAEYGAGAAHDEKIRAGMAGVIINRIRAWHERGQVQMLEQFSGRIGVSALHIFSATDFEAEMLWRQAARVRGLRDL